MDRTVKQILVAEDNAADVRLIRETLSAQELIYELQILTNGEEALEFLDRLDADGVISCPDLLLLDLHLPRRNGQEVLGRLRASQRCGHVPVIVLSGSAPPERPDRPRKGAWLEYLRKPSDLAQLMLLGLRIKQVLELPLPVVGDCEGAA